MRHTLHIGDNLAILPTLPDNSVDAIVTDPPYGLVFMGKDWDKDVPGPATWRECLRVLKPGGHLLAFAGTRTQHKMATAIELAGFKIRDMIAWVYGSGFPKSLNVGKKVEQWHGWGTALKPALEPITVARKPIDGTVAENVLRHGTGAINVDACRVEMISGDGWNVPNPDTKKVRPAVSSVANGTPSNIRHKSMRSTPASGGRWPANLIHDGSQEVLDLFPVDDEQSAARFFYCPKANKRDRDDGCEGFNQVRESDREKDDGVGGDNPRNRSNNARRNYHPTVKPTDLMRYLCRLVTPPGGTVLDPFTGSGSTGKAAVLEGFNFIGIELSPDYSAIAEARIKAAYKEPD